MSDEQGSTLPAPVLYKFTNQEKSPELDNILAMFYHGVYQNTIGIMLSHNLETGEEEILLVGVQLDEDNKPDVYPLAVALRAEDVNKYLAPDGKGGFYDPRNMVESSIAKEGMKSYEDSVVDSAPVETVED